MTLGEPEAEEGAEKLPPAPPAPAPPADALVVGEEAEEGDTVGAAGVGVGLSLREWSSEDEGSADAHAVTLEEVAREGVGVRLAASVTEVPALGEAASVRVGEGSNEGEGRALREGNCETMGEGVVLSHDDAVAFAFALGESGGVGVGELSGEAERVAALVGEDTSESVAKALREGNGDAFGEGVVLSHGEEVELAFALGDSGGVWVSEDSGEADNVATMVSEDCNEYVGKAVREGKGDVIGEAEVLSHDDAVELAFALGVGGSVGVSEGSGEAESVVAIDAVEDSQGEGAALADDE